MGFLVSGTAGGRGQNLEVGKAIGRLHQEDRKDISKGTCQAVWSCERIAGAYLLDVTVERWVPMARECVLASLSYS
jgi:hypothetical protein